MAELDLPHALTRLLTDAALRRAFARDPSAVAERIAVRPSDRSALTSMKPDDLERQAQGLISKRFHEVAHQLPRTMVLLGNDARSLFDAFASQFWPTGHRRHAIDASAFCAYLRRHGHRVSASEDARVRFLARQRRVQVMLIDDWFIRGRPRRAVRVHYRTLRGSVGSFTLGLAM